MSKISKSEFTNSEILPPRDGIQESIEAPKPIQDSPQDLPVSFSLKELKEFNIPEPVPLVEGFLYMKNISIIAAKPKVGKSTLLRNLAASIVDGHEFLGRKTALGSVLYLALDEPRFNVQRDFIAMNVKNDASIFISFLSGVHDKSQTIENLVIKHSPSLVIVDTLINATGIRDINEYVQVTHEMKRFRDLAEQYGCHICLVHHSKKGESQGNDSVLGSTALTGAVDLIVTMDARGENNDERFISSCGRSGEHFQKMKLSFDPDTKHFGKAQNRRDDIAELILDVIADTPGIDRDGIQKAVRKNSQDVTASLKALVTDRQIEAVRDKASKKTCYFFIDQQDEAGDL
jgi:RecA-family ATPase